MYFSKILLSSAVLATTLISSNSVFASEVDSEPVTQVDQIDNVYQLNAEVTPFNAGVWNQVGQQTFTGITGLRTLQTKVFGSYGGDFKLVFHFQEDNPLKVQLWEYDSGGTDVLVRDWTTVNGHGGSITYRDIGSYVDGSDGKAEFYAIIKTTDSTPKQLGLQVTAYD